MSPSYEVAPSIDMYPEALGPTASDCLRILQGGIRFLQERNAELTRLAYTDPLSEIYNRRGMYAWAEREYNANACNSLFVIDICDFGEINNQHGQDMGDVYIALLGATLSEVTRARPEQNSVRQRGIGGSDYAAIRLGGDEFACIIPANTFIQSDIEAMNGKIAKRICRAYAHNAAQQQLPVEPRLYIGWITNEIGEPFGVFFDRGNKQINSIKAAQKLADKPRIS